MSAGGDTERPGWDSDDLAVAQAVIDAANLMPEVSDEA